MGLCSAGDMKVLSTLTSTPFACAISQTAAMSVSTISGIGRRLDMDQLRIRLDGGFHCIEIGGVDVLDRNSVVLNDQVEQPRGAAIHIGRADQVIAGAQRRNKRIDRRHAAGEGMSARASLKRRQRLFNPRAGGIARAGVVIASVRFDPG